MGYFIIGLVLGVIVCAVGVLLLMPKKMIVIGRSQFGFEETVAAIEKSLAERGWTSPGSIDMNRSLANKGVLFQPRVRIIQMCKPDYACDVLNTDRYISCMMPCSVSVYESDEGKVFISKMNTGLMGKLFRGNIARVMGTQVSRDEKLMLEPILKT